ncbi:MAG: ABC transporter permease [Bacteroidales bacterium]|nr:ABC transporter permease [Candidatus Liminaster caballi]
MADNFLERQYAAYEERKKRIGKPVRKSSVQFYTRPGRPKTDNTDSGAPE